jgi:hypothetical protein
MTVAEPNTSLGLIDAAVRAVDGLLLPRQSEFVWERRSAQVWYRLTASPGRGDAPANRLVLTAGVVVPLIDQMDPEGARDERLGTIGGNLRALDGEKGQVDDLVFEVVKSRGGALAGRLNSPVRSTVKVRYLVEGPDSIEELSAALARTVVPLTELTSWRAVADHLGAKGATMARAGLCSRHWSGQQGILVWADGDQSTGARLIRAGLPAERAESVLERLVERFS